MAEYVKWSEETIKRVRDSVSLPDLVDPDGRYRRTSQGIVIHCPFHDDSEPSMAVYDRQYVCFSGSCGEKGDAIEWLKRQHHMSFQEAVVTLAQRAGIDLDGPSGCSNGTGSATTSVLGAAKALFREQQEVAHKYLISRGISADIIDQFECGFAHAKGCNSLFTQYTKDQLHEAGLYNEIGEGNLANVFRNRCMFPIYDGSALVGFAGRVLDDKTPKYKNSPDSATFKKGSLVFGLKQAAPYIRKQSSAIVVEGYLDVLSLATHGVKNSVCTMGTALTDQHYRKIRRAVGHSGEIVFCFDGDAAGIIAAKKAAIKSLACMRDGERVSILTLPDSMDPDDLLSKQGIHAWNFLFERREPLSAFLTRNIINIETPEDASSSYIKAKEIVGHIENAPAYKMALSNLWERFLGVSLRGGVMALKAAQREIKRDQLVFDATPFGKKVKERFFDPVPYRLFLLCLTAASLMLPMLLPIWLLTLWACSMLRGERSFRLPLRIPKDAGIRDPSDYQEVMKEESLWFGLIKRSKIVKKISFGAGILYLGFLRSADRSKKGQELWLTNSDARTHLFLAGTTGSGKTETNLGIYANSLCWGSGTVYADGKGDSSLPFSMWSMARKFGREDDFLLLNFLTGGEDPLERFSRMEKGLEVDLPQSNNQNPYAYGSADFLFNLTSSLLPEASGDSAGWQDKALNLISALTQVFCYKRAQGEFQISIGQYRHYLALDNLVKLYKESLEPGAPELAYQPIKSYFETGLPGFNPALVDRPEEWDPEVRNQHGYLTGQFSRVLSMMMDTYGYIFDTQSPEIDPEDVLLNNRILCILVPSLEKSPSEASALGKLTVSSVRLMMARNLGFKVEGNEDEVLNIKQTNSPYPSIIIWDELAYYFAEGIAVMYAQARSLGFMMVASVQDVQKLMDAGDKGEIGALIANTKVKWTLALEDAAETFDIFKKAADEGFFSVLSGHDRETGMIGSPSWKNQSSTRVEKQARLTIDELKNLSPGQGVVIFQDQVVRCSSFYIPDEDKRARKVEVKLNRFLPMAPPSIDQAPACLRLPKDYMGETSKAIAHLKKGLPAAFPHLNDPILEKLIDVSQQVEQLQESSIDVDPELIGPIMFEAAVEAMKAAEAEEQGSWMPHERSLDNEEFFDDEL